MGVSRNNIIFSPVRIGKQPDFMDFTCGSISTAGIKRINSLKMYRLTRKEGSGTRSNIVSVYPNEEPTIEAQDLRAAGTTVQGSVVNDQYSIQAFATLTIPTIKLICDDVGQYTCELNYEDSNGVVVIPPMQDSINFTGYGKFDYLAIKIFDDVFIYIPKDLLAHMRR